jgi:hypothetical protein
MATFALPKPVPHSQSAGETGRTPNADARNQPFPTGLSTSTLSTPDLREEADIFGFGAAAVRATLPP